MSIIIIYIVFFLSSFPLVFSFEKQESFTISLKLGVLGMELLNFQTVYTAPWRWPE